MPSDDLEYADDVSFVHRTPRALHDKVKQAKEHLGEWGLGVNDTKTQWLEVKGGSSEWKECVYLGSCLDTEADIKRRCHQANAALHIIRTVVFRHNIIPTGLTLKLFKALVMTVHVLLYNSELWTTKQTQLVVRPLHKSYPKFASSTGPDASPQCIRHEETQRMPTITVDRHCKENVATISLIDRGSQHHCRQRPVAGTSC